MAIESVIRSLSPAASWQAPRTMRVPGSYGASPQAARRADYFALSPGMNGASSNTANNRAGLASNTTAQPGQPGTSRLRTKQRRWHPAPGSIVAGTATSPYGQRRFREFCWPMTSTGCRSRMLRACCWAQGATSSGWWHADGGRDRSGSPGRGQGNEPLIMPRREMHFKQAGGNSPACAYFGAVRLRKFRDFVIWREGGHIDSIGGGRESLSPQFISSARVREFAMAVEDAPGYS